MSELEICHSAFVLVNIWFDMQNKEILLNLKNGGFLKHSSCFPAEGQRGWPGSF